MKKRFLAALCIFSMFMTACGGMNEAEKAELEEKIEKIQEDAEEEIEKLNEEIEALQEETSALQDEIVSLQEAYEEMQTMSAEESASDDYIDAEYHRGSIGVDEWENEWIGLRYVCPDGVELASEEEINTAMGLGEMILSEDFSEEEMEQVFETSVYEMIASKSGSDDNLIIAVEKLPMEMTEETYAQIAVANLTALESLDCDIEISDDYVMIGDVEFLEITSITKYDVLTFAQNIYVNIKEDRATVITITHEDDEATKDLLLSGFQAH